MSDLSRAVGEDLQPSIALVGRDRAAPGAGRSSRPDGRRFRILKLHAQGGLGRVYEAQDEELGRTVALKEIQPDKADRHDLRSRFVLEAEINGGLQHPGIVPVYSLGHYDDGKPFYAMRFVEGASLRDAVARHHEARPNPDPSTKEFRDLLNRFLDVCNAIGFAHSKGVLHRDLKPHNVMIGNYGEALIIDWGLAKATGKHDEVSSGGRVEETLVPPSGSAVEETRGVIGTPSYMSPEQAEGRVDELGPATDVYGLGAILYHVLTNQPPIMGGAVDEVIARVIKGEVVSPRTLNPNVPAALEAVCLKALARTPENRYPTARDLADDVERWMSDEPVSVRPDTPVEKLFRAARKHRTLTATTAVALVAGLVGLAGLAEIQRRAAETQRRANKELTLANARGDRWLDRATQALARYHHGLEQEELLFKQPQLRSLRDRLLNQARTFYEEFIADPSLKTDPRGQTLLARSRMGLGDVERVLGHGDRAVKEAAAAVELFAGLARAKPGDREAAAELASAVDRQALALYTNGNLEASTEQYRRAVSAWEELGRTGTLSKGDRSGLANALIGLGNLLRRREILKECLEVYQKAETLLERLVSENPGERGLLYLYAGLEFDLAGLFVIQGNARGADARYRASLAQWESLVRVDPKDDQSWRWVANVNADRGNLLRLTGHFKESRDAYDRAVAIQEKRVAASPELPDERDALARSRYGLGQLGMVEGALDDALTNTRKAVDLWERLLQEAALPAEVRKSLATAYTNLVQIDLALNRPEEAEKAGRRAVDLAEAVLAANPTLPESRSVLAGNLDVLGRALHALGRTAEAVPLLQRSIVEERRAIAAVPGRPDFPMFLREHVLQLAVVLFTLDRSDEADAVLKGWESGHDDLASSARELAGSLPAGPAHERQAAAAVSLLERASALGWSKAGEASTDPALNPLRGRDDFQRWLTGLLERAMPEDPFR
ncbi:MAG: serine/threonine-protein kinase [Isosphaeraceae bacterium]